MRIVLYHPKASISKKAIHELASQLRKNPKITSRIYELQSPVVEAAQLSLARRLEELSYAAFLDPIHAFDEHARPLSIHDMPEHVRRAIASYEIDPEKFIRKIRLVDKRGAIMDYSKLAGDIPKGGVPLMPPYQPRYDFSKLTSAEWEQYRALRRKTLVEYDLSSHT
jgi:hypothetical protein